MKVLLALLLFAGTAVAQWDGSLRRTALVTGSEIPAMEEPAYRSILQENGAGEAEMKSVPKAVLYSLLLPGMGELYVGEYGTGKYFTIAEAALVITLGSVHWYANWLQNDARSYAAQHAGAPADGKSDQYYIDLGNFDNIYAYNEAVLRSRDVFKVYDPSSSSYWNWDADANREQYRQLRVESDNMFNNTRFVVAAIAINHIASAINAGRSAISHNSQIAASGTFDVRASLRGGILHPDGIVVNVSHTF
jgi:hypothetical protein